MNFEKEYETLVKYYESSGGDRRYLQSEEYASMVINHDKVLHVSSTEGIKINAKKIENGVEAEILIKENYSSVNPVHLCFGMLPKEGKQVIKTKIIAERGSKIKFLSHCIFPNAVNIEHVMDSVVHVGENAVVEYEEVHMHGKEGMIKVVPHAKVYVEKGGEYNTTFVVKTGRAGHIDINYEVNLGEKAKSTLLSKIYGRYDDEIHAKESMYLNGENSKGLIKTRMVLRDSSKSEVIGEVIGRGAFSRGHVDCMEIIMDDAVVKASPVVVAEHPRAKVTHEAAIGSVDKKQLLTLMARGLSEEEAVDFIVGGLLR